ncbi:glycosyltransferase family 4 protein [Microbacterium marmarense]|uniref:Glycosyltransferase family 4 protein n=1 Tax=Microbacterium marmarense TaxID=3122051 RepID=A0ABU8LSL7_9MICO
MRILISFPHSLGATGIGWSAWNQADSLIRAGHEVHVVAASVGRPIVGAASVTTTLSARRLRVPHRAIGRERAFRWHDLQARRTLARTPVDVAHLWPLGEGLTAAAARASGVAVVREAPNTHTERAWRTVGAETHRLGIVAEPTAHTPSASHLRMERAEWAASTAILAPSQAVRDSFVAEGFSPERVLRHRYGYRPGTRRPRVRSADPRPLRVVYVGLGEPRKGLHHALQAWRASRASVDGTFTVIGRMLPAYSRAIASDLAQPSVRVVGFSDDVEAALASADALVLPTVEEGSALVTYEAQAMGCVPLVSTAAGAVIEDGVQGLLHTPGDVATLTSQFDLLASDRAVLARLSKAALEHASHLTWDAAAIELLAAYQVAVQMAGRSDAVGQ